MRPNTKKNKPYIIGISGESGVGKSTITEIVTLFFGIKDVTAISTDDLHKWERSNDAWNNITHLNPLANNLELGDMHLNELSLGKSIYRSVYNHKTGNFNPPLKIEPKQYVIIEGLHAFFTDISKELIDLKIFIDTDDELRTHWKIIRDTEERGYKYNDVLDSIHKRRSDSGKIREAQIGASEVVVKIYPVNKIKCIGDKSEKIDLDILILTTHKVKRNERCQKLCDFIKNYIISFNDFIDMSELVGGNIELCQNGGGNISVKVSDKYMIIKSSGLDLKDVYKLHGYSVIDYNSLAYAKISDEKTLSQSIFRSLVMEKYKRPSMETGAHILLTKKYVLHAHPIYLTLLLCLKDSESIIAELFNDYDYKYVKYVPPAFGLYSKLKEISGHNVYFLENHGVIISAESAGLAYNIMLDINHKAKAYIGERCCLEVFDLKFNDIDIDDNGYVFPDSVIFETNNLKKEIGAASNYIKLFGKQIGEIRYLSPTEVSYIANMEAEKYRKNL